MTRLRATRTSALLRTLVPSLAFLAAFTPFMLPAARGASDPEHTTVAFIIQVSPATPPAYPQTIEYVVRRAAIWSAGGKLIDVTRWRPSGAGADATATVRIERNEIQLTVARTAAPGAVAEPYRAVFRSASAAGLVEQAALAGASIGQNLAGGALCVPAAKSVKEAALADFEKALAQGAGTSRALIEKRSLLSRAAEAEPDWPAVRLELGRTMLAQGDAKAAADTLAKALGLAGDDPEVRGELARAHAGLGRTADAISNYARALAGAPADPVLHNNFAAALIAAGELDAALDHARKAIEIEPLYSDPHVNLGTYYRLSGKDAEAEAEYRRAVALAPTEAGPRIALAKLLVQRGDPPGAQQALEPALAANPDHAALLFQYALILATRQRYSAAIEHLRRVMELAPGYREAAYNLGLCQHYMGRHDEAIRTFEQALDREPDYALLYYGLGLAYESKRQNRLAEEAFKMALEKDSRLTAAEAALRRLRGEGTPPRLAWPWGLVCGQSERKESAASMLPSLITLAALLGPALLVRACCGGGQKKS